MRNVIWSKKGLNDKNIIQFCIDFSLKTNVSVWSKIFLQSKITVPFYSFLPDLTCFWFNLLCFAYFYSVSEVVVFATGSKYSLCFWRSEILYWHHSSWRTAPYRDDPSVPAAGPEGQGRCGGARATGQAGGQCCRNNWQQQQCGPGSKAGTSGTAAKTDRLCRWRLKKILTSVQWCQGEGNIFKARGSKCRCGSEPSFFKPLVVIHTGWKNFHPKTITITHTT